MNVKYLILILLFSFCCKVLAMGEDELIEVSIDSKITKQKLSVKVSLPRDYKDNVDKHYPVFITTAGGSRIDSVIAQVKWLSHVNFAPIPQVIIMTIPDIKYEKKDKFTSAAGQESTVLASVLAGEVLPYIDSTYRTSGYRMIEGFSSFGNFPLYMLRHHSDLINAFFIFSPALGLDKSGLVDSLADDWQLSAKRQHYVFLSLGSFVENRPLFEQAKRSLNKLAKSQQLQLEFADYSKDNYLSAPNIGLIKASQSAFSDLQPDYQMFHEQGELALTQYFQQLNIKYNENIEITNKLVDLAFSYAEHEKFTQAIAVMKRVVAKKPNNTLLNLRLAQVQIKANHHEEAKLSLTKAYELAQQENNAEAQSYINNIMSSLN